MTQDAAHKGFCWIFPLYRPSRSLEQFRTRGLLLFDESVTLHEAFKRAPQSLRGACLREGFAEPPRRLHELFAEVYEPFAEIAYTEGSTKTPWRVHEASSKGPWMNCMFLLDDARNRVWSTSYCFFHLLCF